MVAHACNPSPQETAARVSWVGGQPGLQSYIVLYSETLFQKLKKGEKKSEGIPEALCLQYSSSLQGMVSEGIYELDIKSGMRNECGKWL
jgi:hypothetical protein